ncbi:MAG: hypothetical protein ACR2ML_06155 [Solirubrobacteraceae bacterium]
MAEPLVTVEGLRDLRRDLKRIGTDANRDARDALRRAGQKVLDKAAGDAPRGTRPLPPGRRKRLYQTGRVAVTQRAVDIRFTAPYAKVVHWGGTIRPRGAPITFRRRPFLADAAEAQMDEFVDELERELDGIFARNGYT